MAYRGRIILASFATLTLVSTPMAAFAAEPSADNDPSQGHDASVLGDDGRPRPSSGSGSSQEGPAPAVVTSVKVPTTGDVLGAAGIATTAANPPISLGNDKYLCKYTGANWWAYEWDGAPASWEKTTGTSYTHYGAQDLRNSNLFGGTKDSTYSAEIGEGRVLNGSGWRSISVKYNWSYKGDFITNSEIAPYLFGGFSEASLDFRTNADLRRFDVGAPLEVAKFRVTADRGYPVELHNVTSSGTATRTVPVVSGDSVYAVLQSNVTMRAQNQAATLLKLGSTSPTRTARAGAMV